VGPTKIPTPTVRQGRTFSIGRRSFLRSSLLLHARTIVFSRGPGLIFPETSGAVKKMRRRRRVCVGKPNGELPGLEPGIGASGLAKNKGRKKEFSISK